jgi:hypothetical protein
MKCANRVRLFGILCLAMAGTGGGQTPLDSHEEFVCTSGPQKRVVRIYNRTASNGKQELGACRVDYTKDGKTKTVWTSKADPAYCTAKALSLVTKLVEGNYSCKPEAVEHPNETETPEQAPAPNDAPHDDAKTITPP